MNSALGKRGTKLALGIIVILLIGGYFRRAAKEPAGPVIHTTSQEVQPQPTKVQPTTEVESVPEPKPPAKPPEVATEPIPTPPEPPGSVKEAEPDPPTETPPVDPTPPPATGPPALAHTAPRFGRMGSFLPLTARLENLRPVEIQAFKITAYYRASGTAAYKRTDLSRTRSTWTGNIRITAEMEGGLEYFLKAKSTDPTGAMGTLTSGTNTAPHSVRVSSP